MAKAVKPKAAAVSNRSAEAVPMPVDTKSLISNMDRLRGKKNALTVDITREAFEANAFPVDRLPDSEGVELVDIYQVSHVGDPGSQIAASILKSDADIIIQESRKGSPGVGFFARPTPPEHQNPEGAKRHSEYIQQVLGQGRPAGEVGNAALLEHIAMLTGQVAALTTMMVEKEKNK